MPTFHIELFEGRSVEQKRQFVEAITKATCESLGVEPNSVDIILTDVKRENWATGGRFVVRRGRMIVRICHPTS
ncbi:4-oxalocrotonate tautomerase [Burkholderia sp. ST111]|nr:4-oxalocrotonate tautomerase [Burkholderia sp. ST111]